MVNLADIKPMLLDERPIDYDAPGWIFEIKHDGYRLLAEFGEGACKLRSRNSADATKWLPELCDALSKVPAGLYIIDGEVCVLDDLGRSDFERSTPAPSGADGLRGPTGLATAFSTSWRSTARQS